MRVISGKFKSRILAEPSGHVAHPMGERVRAALFNILHDVSDMAVLDAFAGGGSIAVEAVSRGAKYAWAIEKSPKVYKTLKENVESLNLEDQIKATRANVSTWIDNNEDLMFDLIICDPPYNDLNPLLISKLGSHLSKDGELILSHLSSIEPFNIKGLSYVSSSSYGNATLSFYKR